MVNGATAALRTASPIRAGAHSAKPAPSPKTQELPMHQIIYIVGAIVIVVALLSFVGLS